MVNDAFKLLPRQLNYRRPYEVVYVTIRNQAFCLALYLTGVHFRGELLHVGHVGEQKIKCQPIKSSRPEVFLGKSVLKIWGKFIGGEPCRSVILTNSLRNFIEFPL